MTGASQASSPTAPSIAVTATATQTNHSKK